MLGLLGFFDLEGFLASAADTLPRVALPPGSTRRSDEPRSFLRSTLGRANAGVSWPSGSSGPPDSTSSAAPRPRGCWRARLSCGASTGSLRTGGTSTRSTTGSSSTCRSTSRTGPHVHFEQGVLQKVNTGGEALGLGPLGGRRTGSTGTSSTLLRTGSPSGGQSLSRVFRRIQTGVVEYYALVLVLGLAGAARPLVVTRRGCTAGL